MTTTTQAPHTAATRPLELGAAAVVVFLCLCWGFNQVAVKLALTDIPPLTQAAIRSTGAALIIWIYARSRGISLDLGGETLKPGLVAGVLFGLEFIFIYRGAALHHGQSRHPVHLRRAVRRGARLAFPGTDRSLPLDPMGRSADVVFRSGAGLRSADAIRRCEPDARRPAGAGGRHRLGLHDAGGEIDFARPRRPGKDAAIPAGDLGADARCRRLAARRNHHPDAGRPRPDLARLPDRVGGFADVSDLVHAWCRNTRPAVFRPSHS